MLRKYCYLNKKQSEFIKNLRNNSQEPTSVILKSRGVLPKELTGGPDSIAVRLPADLPKNDFLIKIVRGVKKPIVSTSLNLSGKKNLEEVGGVEKYFKGLRPDLVIDAGRIKRVKPSRVVDIREMKEVRVVRR